MALAPCGTWWVACRIVVDVTSGESGIFVFKGVNEIGTLPKTSCLAIRTLHATAVLSVSEVACRREAMSQATGKSPCPSSETGSPSLTGAGELSWDR
jgi:hypothetical protein